MNEIITAGSGAVQTTREVSQSLLEQFIKYADICDKSAETYAKDLRQMYLYFAMHDITRPTREDLLGWKDELKATGHKPTTIQNYITAAKVFFSWAAQMNLYPNIAEHIKGAKIDRGHKKDYLASTQVKEILGGIDKAAVTGKRDYAILALMTICGLRTIEVSRANIEDLQTIGDTAVLYVQGKGHEEKTDYVKIDAKLEATIRDYLKDRAIKDTSEPLFSSTSNNSKGERLSTRTIRGIAKDAMRAAGYNSSKLTAHSFRHTAVTLALLAGKPLEEVSEFARHKDISTTLIYAHHLDKAKNSCGEAVAAAVL